MDCINCIIGIDGGGTKTQLRAVKPDGTYILDVFGASTNICSNTKDVVYANIKNLWESAKEKSGVNLQAKSVCLGTAGISNLEAKPFLLRSLCEIMNTKNASVIGDLELPLLANAKKSNAVIIISGTGSVAFGKNEEGQTERLGGYGHIIGDFGSGYHIAVKGLGAVLRSNDGLIEKTLLTAEMLNKARLNNTAELLSLIYDKNNTNKAHIAEFALCVKEAAQKGDVIALAILDEAANALIELCVGIVNKLNLLDKEFEIILSGGVLLKNPILNKQFKNTITSKYRSASVFDAEADAVQGAVIKARSLL